MTMENRVADKTMTTCASVLVALFQKRRKDKNSTQTKGRCSCLCHTYENKNKNLSEINEMNDNKFFNCKCNHDCEKLVCKKCDNRKEKRRKPVKKIVKFQIEHTGSMSSLASPNKQTTNPHCSCDKLRHPLSLCKMLNGKPIAESARNALHHGSCQIHRKFKTWFFQYWIISINSQTR